MACFQRVNGSRTRLSKCSPLPLGPGACLPMAALGAVLLKHEMFENEMACAVSGGGRPLRRSEMLSGCSRT